MFATALVDQPGEHLGRTITGIFQRHFNGLPTPANGFRRLPTASDDPTFEFSGIDYQGPSVLDQLWAA